MTNPIDAWVLFASQSDYESISGKNRGRWERVAVNCQQRSLMKRSLASISPTGDVRKAIEYPARPAVIAAPGSTDARVVDGICNPMPNGTSFASSVFDASENTRNGTPLPGPTSGPIPRIATSPLPSLSPPMKRECAINYDTLANIAVVRRMRAILGEINAADVPALLAASKDYRSRATSADPALSGVVLYAESSKRQAAYDQAEGEARGPAKMAVLNRIKALAAECDRALGLNAIPLP